MVLVVLQHFINFQAISGIVACVNTTDEDFLVGFCNRRVQWGAQ